MRYHRFISDFDLDKERLEVTDEHLRSQWHSVLRLVSGDTVILCDGRGREAMATIEDMNKKATVFSLRNVIETNPGPSKQVTLYTSLLRRENFEIVVQKATEIGIAHIVPLLTERTVKTGFNRVRLEKILLEAAEQSGRTMLPALSEPIAFADAIESVSPKDSILFDGSGDAVPGPVSAIHLFVGPEGGFSDKEVELARDAGIPIASLGGLTLRAETAAIVVSYLSIQ